MSQNTLLTLLALLAVVLTTGGMYWIAKNRKTQVKEDELDNFERILEHVKRRVAEMDMAGESYADSTDEEYRRAYQRKARLRSALANSVHGIDEARDIVIGHIRGIIAEDVNPAVVSALLGFPGTPPPEIQFEILLYRFKRRYGKQALGELIRQYDWHRLRQTKGGQGAYFVTGEDVLTAYEREEIHLSAGEQLDVLSVLLFARYKGFGVIDTIREMDIDGTSGGVSGAMLPQIKKSQPEERRVENSIWILFGGKQIHLSFLSFGNEDELRRITLALIRYGAKGSLTQNVGKVVSTAWDKARVTALCPPASQSWAYFVRKFGFSGKKPEELLIKPYTQKGELVIELLRFLMSGQVTCGVTGRQGTGKTTLMTAIIGYIDPRYTIRTLEMAFEMYLRDIYPERNILAVQETPFVSSAVLQDTLKKTDAAVSIVGEVAEDGVAARMIQMGLVSSLFTLFSHHALSAEDLVLALRNSLVNAGGFPNMDTAERLVVDVVRVNVHLGATLEGKRYVERITEIIPLPPGQPYPEYVPGDGDSMNRITREYYTRQTDRRSFVTRDILRYDLETDTYYTLKRPSDTLHEAMRTAMGEEAASFDLFLQENWRDEA